MSCRRSRYVTARRRFARGDALLFVSDGVIEARKGQVTFGMDRLIEDAGRIYKDTGKLDAQSVVTRVRAFLDGQPPQDDICLLSVQFEALENGAR